MLENDVYVHHCIPHMDLNADTRLGLMSELIWLYVVIDT